MTKAARKNLGLMSAGAEGILAKILLQRKNRAIGSRL
jgi:hypothetical protein